jgi:hypothetical protein
MTDDSTIDRPLSKIISAYSCIDRLIDDWAATEQRHSAARPAVMNNKTAVGRFGGFVIHSATG